MSTKARFVCYSHLMSLALVLFFHVLGDAQIDSNNLLQPVEVTAQRIRLTDIGKHTEVIDSAELSIGHHESLAELLSVHAPLFVRSYGAGTLATLGIRGGGASHTQILWNGIPLRNPMVGLVDLALIPSVFIDEASVHYGGHGAAFGSGAVGGLISVSNQKLVSGNTIQLSMNAGSWGYRSGQLRIDYGTQRLKFSSRIFSNTSDNNYRYRVAEGLPEKNQVHNHINNYGALQEVYFSISAKQSLVARMWYQEIKKQIPPLTTQSTSKAAQQDENIRMSLQWNHQGDKFQWQVKSAWLDETINYQDTLILLFTHNRFMTWLGELSGSVRLSDKIDLTAGVYTETSKGRSLNYTEGLQREQSAAFSSLRFYTGDLIWRLQARQEVTAGDLSPLLYDISAEWPFLKHLSFRTSFSKNYRTPTLNDLHWRPGGNPALKPEEGFTFEAGIDHLFHNKHLTLRSSMTGYTRLMNEWIMWMPPMKDVSLFWSPINVAKVKTNGIETRGHLTLKKEHWNLDLKLGLDLTWSFFSTSINEFNIKSGDKVFYVPVENILTSVRYSLGKWTIHYDHHWFGASSGINDDIAAFHIGNGGMSYLLGNKALKCSIYIQVDNAWNVPYRIIERRPMPGRTFTSGFKFSFS